MDFPGQMELFAEFEGVKPVDPARAKQRAIVEELQARPLMGGCIEEGQSLMDLDGKEGENLFNRAEPQRRPTAEIEDKPQDTPMIRQWKRIRREVSEDTILFYRLGDFYEMLGDDAIRAAPILELALTRRGGIPLCGVPYHAVDTYLVKAVRAGLKVAVCEYMERASRARGGVIRQEVARIVGTEADIVEVLV